MTLGLSEAWGSAIGGAIVACALAVTGVVVAFGAWVWAKAVRAVFEAVELQQQTVGLRDALEATTAAADSTKRELARQRERDTPTEDELFAAAIAANVPSSNGRAPQRQSGPLWGVGSTVVNDVGDDVPPPIPGPSGPFR
jgi:hypothetical protein